MNTKFILLSALFFLQFSFVQGQGGNSFVDRSVQDSIDAPDLSFFSTQKMEKAKALYDDMGYKSAQEKLLELSKETTLDVESMVRLANSYRLNGEPGNAEYWYREFIDQNRNPMHFLHFAQVLQTNGKCEESIVYYNKYYQISSKENKVHRSFITTCAEAESMLSARGAVVRELKGINSGHLEFSPVQYKDGIVFTSTRSKSSFMKTKDSWTNDNFSNLFFAAKDEIGVYSKIKPLEGFKNSRFHDGAATFSSTGDYMLFTRNRERVKEGMLVLKIYEAQLVNNEWTNIKELDFNSNDFSTCHPYLSPDGKTLCFTSNRPGGYGGMDIYFCEKIGDTWGEPVNAGPEINTEGNEIFPFLMNEKEIYFSSDGHKTIGGLDIFKATRENANSSTPWTFQQNLGAPINSYHDDFSFFMHGDGEHGFFSSNRNPGTKDDIFEWQFVDEPETPVLTEVIVRDHKTRIPVAGTKVVILPSGASMSSEAINLTTDEYGTIAVPIGTAENLTFRIQAESYKPFEHQLKELTARNGGYEILLQKEIVTHTISGNVISKTSLKPIPNSSIRVENQCSQEFFETTSDANGKYALKLSCDCNYIVTVMKDNFQTAQEIFELEECEARRNKTISLAMNAPVEKTMLTEKRPDRYIAPLPLKLDVERTIELENIYYDHNRHIIRPDAAYQLDKLYAIMVEHPGMEIELLSHTDSRGNSRYNMRLSQRRADAAVRYLVQKGISSSRMKAAGMGESELLNGCVDGVTCSDDEHQENRRTEIRVTKLNGEKMKIIYR